MASPKTSPKSDEADYILLRKQLTEARDNCPADQQDVKLSLTAAIVAMDLFHRLVVSFEKIGAKL